MKVYYLQHLELGWDNVICIATSPQKCIESYTAGEVILKTEEDVEEYLISNRYLYMGYKFLEN